MAIQALIDGGMARTYPEAAELVGMSEGTMLTHINRDRTRHPELYKAIRKCGWLSWLIDMWMRWLRVEPTAPSTSGNDHGTYGAGSGNLHSSCVYWVLVSGPGNGLKRPRQSS